MTRAIFWLLAGHLILGIAHIAVLPPWEGFDELAHYSYVQHLADRGEVPRLYEARVSADVERYSRIGPLPYSLQGFDSLTYDTFFAGSGDDLTPATAFIHGRPGRPRRYAAGDHHNWQAQHPPFYYLVVSPVYLSTRNLSWATHVLALRFASYLLAWTALLIGAHACLTAVPPALNGGPSTWRSAALGIALWPLILPSWFSEMARIGNDSMCALILAAVWWLALRASATGFSMLQAVALGALLGAGCLTKVFFVPVTIACLGFWSVRAWTLGGMRSLASHIPRMATALLVAGVVAGWWYVWNWREYGVPFGSLELIELRRRGGILLGLAEHMSLLGLLKAPLIMGVTLAWPGTWSLVGAPLVSLAPIGLTVILAAGAYCAALRRFRLSTVAWLPAWLLCLMLLGLGWKTLTRMALLGKVQPAYYLHFLAPALGAAVGIGLGACWCSKPFRRAVTGGIAYAFLFGAGLFWAQIMLFSGMQVWHGEDGSRIYSPAALFRGVPELPEAVTRLAVLAYPWLGATTWLVGATCILIGLAWTWKASRAPEAPVRIDR